VVRLAQLSTVFAKARQSLDLLREFARIPHERLAGSTLIEYKGGLEFKDLSFSYPDGNAPLFESLSLKLEPGAVLVVAGANGTGKTTLARLIVGLLEPLRGQILVDGVDLAQIQPEWWRRQVVYMPQEPRFLNASLRDNLLAYNPELDEEGLNKVISSTGLRSFINESPKGFATPVIQNGSNLSLGIRRRLALARALAGNGRLVVVDEPTEGLDVEGSQQVYGILNEFARRGSAIIAFSHDPQILRGTRHILDLNSKPVPRLVSTAEKTPDTPATRSKRGKKS
jgi:ATP-binding cassette subfamily C protein LapB